MYASRKASKAGSALKRISNEQKMTKQTYCASVVDIREALLLLSSLNSSTTL